MRFGIPDDDEDDYQAELEIQFESYSSDESDQLPDFARWVHHRQWGKIG